MRPRPTRMFAPLLALLAGCHRGPAVPADVIVVHGHIFLADSTDTFVEALAIRGDTVMAVGTTAEIQALRGDSTRVIDARGAAVTPGFNDAHVHFIEGALSLDLVNLLDAETLPVVEGRIRDFAAAHPDAPWVLGLGWLYGAFPGGLPTRQQLDALVPDRPAAIDCYDGHTKWINSKALALAGIDRHTPDPPDGVIVRDPKTGEPTGALKEGAQSLVEKIIPQPTREQKLAALRRAVLEAHRYGVTSVQEAGVDSADLELLDTLRQSGALNLRMYVALNVHPRFTDAEADRLEAIRQAHPPTPMFRLGAVKLYADGVIEAHTAWMLEPYANLATRGNPETTPSDMTRMVALLDRRGWQVWIHAIGDAGIRMGLDAFDSASARNPAPAAGRRDRLEHIEDASAADIPRFGQLGVIASMQPFHASPNGNVLNVWAVNVGPERASRAWAWKRIQDAGARLAFGTDWPVVGIDPRPGIHTALTRQTPAGQPAGGFGPSERLPLTTVIRTYTAGGAYAEFQEAHKGTLRPGMLADLVVWSGDIFAVPPAEVQHDSVRITLLGGRVVYPPDHAP